jgi:hypothetical protein
VDVLLLIWAISNTQTVPAKYVERFDNTMPVQYVERFDNLAECRAAASAYHDPRIILACVPAVIIQPGPEAERK